MADQHLEQAAELVRSGNIEEARQRLELVIREDRHNLAAWQLYADTWPGTKDKIRVWEVCLRHNPMNSQAQQALAVLRSDTAKRSNTQLNGPAPPAAPHPRNRHDRQRTTRHHGSDGERHLDDGQRTEQPARGRQREHADARHRQRRQACELPASGLTRAAVSSIWAVAWARRRASSGS